MVCNVHHVYAFGYARIDIAVLYKSIVTRANKRKSCGDLGRVWGVGEGGGRGGGQGGGGGVVVDSNQLGTPRAFRQGICMWIKIHI
jgi:hypothetical protein